MTLAGKLFQQYRKLVFIAPCGLVVRAIAPHLRHKTMDPAVVVVDAGGRYAVSLLSGHEGGANQLALQVANLIAAEPVISTTTEATKDLIVGVGCRRGVEARIVVSAVRQALRCAKVSLKQVRMLASASIKSDEVGLLLAAKQLGLELRFIAAEEIRSTPRQFRHSQFVARKVNMPAVAEPSALLAGRRTQLILPKTIFNQVTVAIARENCSS
jgi:cobalt-precorrin 5A hydrolase